MAFGVSDEVLGAIVPAAVYWIYSGFYVILDSLEIFDKYRLHPREEEDVKNISTKTTVVKAVLLQQACQIAVCLLLFTRVGDESGTVRPQPSVPIVLIQFVVAMVMLDTWQYFVHRYMHTNKFLYKHIHSIHHRLVVPYPYGAFYNHPVEDILDTVGGVLAFFISGMTPNTAVFFYSIMIKSVDVHCGMYLPWNPFHLLFYNNSAYHDVHHQLYGNKYNFSQPFFVTWDRIFGTHMPYALERRKEGGFEARPIKKVD